jgi:hypothetical protein
MLLTQISYSTHVTSSMLSARIASDVEIDANSDATFKSGARSEDKIDLESSIPTEVSDTGAGHYLDVMDAKFHQLILVCRTSAISSSKKHK